MSSIPSFKLQTEAAFLPLGPFWRCFLALFALACAVNIVPLVVAPVLVLGLCFVVRCTLAKSLHPAGKVMLWIYGYTVISATVSGVPLSAFWSYDFLRNDAKFLFAYLPFLAALVISHSEKELKRVGAAWVAGAAFPVVMAAVAHEIPWFDIGAHWNYPLFRFTEAGIRVFHGLFIAHTATGSFYALALLFAVFLARASRRPWVFYGAAVVTSVGLILSLSRAFVIGAVLSLILESLLHRRWRLLLSFAAIGGVLLVVAGGLLLDRIQLGKDDPSAVYNTEVRLALWARAVQYVKISPLVGIGFSRFDDYPDTFSGVPGIVALKDVGPVVQTVDGDSEWSMEAHNNYLQILAEQGVIGLLLWALFWYRVLRPIYFLYRRSTPESFQGAWAGACLACSVTVFVASLFDLNFWAPAVMLPLGWALGAALKMSGVPCFGSELRGPRVDPHFSRAALA